MSVFWSSPSKGWNSSPLFIPIGFLSHLLLPNSGILALFLLTLDFWSYPSKVWNFGPIFYICWISDLIFPNNWILTLYFQTLVFWPYFYTDWFSDLILENGEILALPLCTLVFWCYHSKRFNSGPISISIGIILSFQTLEFQPCLNKHWNSDLILPNIAILALFL